MAWLVGLLVVLVFLGLLLSLPKQTLTVLALIGLLIGWGRDFWIVKPDRETEASERQVTVGVTYDQKNRAPQFPLSGGRSQSQRFDGLSLISWRSN